MATLKWDIWTSVPPLVRSEIPTNYYKKFIDDKLDKWSTLTLDDFTKAIYKDKNIVKSEEVFDSIKKIRDKNNKV